MTCNARREAYLRRDLLPVIPNYLIYVKSRQDRCDGDPHAIVSEMTARAYSNPDDRSVLSKRRLRDETIPTAIAKNPARVGFFVPVRFGEVSRGVELGWFGVD